MELGVIYSNDAEIAWNAFHLRQNFANPSLYALFDFCLAQISHNG